MTPMDLFALLGMLLTVVLILVLAYLFTKYLSRFKLGNFKPIKTGGRMQILDQLTMGNDLRLVLVQVGVRYLLLGLSSSGIIQLSELTPEEAALWETADQDPAGFAPGAPPSFRASFLEALKQKRK
jgi:flagellar protein FliO/FliZ